MILAVPLYTSLNGRWLIFLDTKSNASWETCNSSSGSKANLFIQHELEPHPSHHAEWDTISWDMTCVVCTLRATLALTQCAWLRYALNHHYHGFHFKWETHLKWFNAMRKKVADDFIVRKAQTENVTYFRHYICLSITHFVHLIN